tara:strand:- start:294 stop:572 length:279 start_codon:yes stop_codon:yes gene_type:complete
MTKPDRNCPRQDDGTGYNVGDLVMVHGIHLGIITLFYAPRGLWVIRLAHDGQELALFRDDFEPLIPKEREDGNDNDGKAKVRPRRGGCVDLS